MELNFCCPSQAGAQPRTDPILRCPPPPPSIASVPMPRRVPRPPTPRPPAPAPRLRPPWEPAAAAAAAGRAVELSLSRLRPSARLAPRQRGEWTASSPAGNLKIKIKEGKEINNKERVRKPKKIQLQGPSRLQARSRPGRRAFGVGTGGAFVRPRPPPARSVPIEETQSG